MLVARTAAQEVASVSRSIPLKSRCEIIEECQVLKYHLSVSHLLRDNLSTKPMISCPLPSAFTKSMTPPLNLLLRPQMMQAACQNCLRRTFRADAQ